MRLVKSLASFVLGLTLIYVLVRYLERTEQVDALSSVSSMDIMVSAILLGNCFTINGLQTRIALSSAGQAQLSVLDILALPIAQNFWGHVIPFQGSFIYAAAFLKAKYRADVRITVSIGLFITLCSLVVGALVGAAHSLFHAPALLPFYLLLALLPLWVVVFKRIFQHLRPRWPLLKRIHDIITQVLQSIVDMTRMPGLLAKVIVLDSCFVLTYAAWSYYLSDALALNIPFMIHVLVAFMMKLSLLVKLTPGNIGITQLFTGGILSMYGYPAEAGILISTLQLGLLIVISFPVALVISLFQFKYFKGIFSKSLNR